MTEPNGDPLLQFSELTEKVARELVFAEPGKGDGHSPDNDLLNRMEALTSTLPFPPDPPVGCPCPTILRISERTNLSLTP